MSAFIGSAFLPPRTKNVPAQRKGIYRAGGAVAEYAQHYCAYYTANIAFKKVRAHAGHVAHVIAHVVGNNGGVAGVVLRNARFNLTNKVCAYVGSLGVYAAAHAGKQSNARCAKGEARKHIAIFGYNIKYACADKAKANNAHAHYRAAGEGNAQRLVYAAGTRRVSGTHVRAGGDLHAEVTGQHAEQRAHKERNRCGYAAKAKPYSRENYRDEYEQQLVFALKECVRAFAYGVGNFGHAGLALVTAGYAARLYKREQQRNRRRSRHGIQKNVHRIRSSKRKFISRREFCIKHDIIKTQNNGTTLRVDKTNHTIVPTAQFTHNT